MRKLLITGGAGFIGSNAVKYFHSEYDRIVILDNLSRVGSRNNLQWLSSEGCSYDLCEVDLSSSADVEEVFKSHGPFDTILHLAGQVAVTTSV